MSDSTRPSAIPPPDHLEPELRALFDAEARYDEMPAESRARIVAKVGAVLLIPAAVGTAAHLASRSVPHLLKSAATWVIFGAGAATGVAGYAAVSHVVEMQRATTTSAPSAVVEPSSSSTWPAPRAPSTSSAAVPVESAESAESADAAAVDPAPPPSTKPVSSARAADPGEDQELRAERAQIEMARTALARGQAASAVSALRADATERPRGRLGEERDSLLVQALVASGQTSEARTRAAAFARRYPKSLFLTAVQAAVP